VAEAIVIFYEDYYGRKPGGQKGHDGTTLKMIDGSDVQVTHRVEECEVCKNHLLRTFTGARYFVSTAQKQQISILDALKDLFGDNQIRMVGAALNSYTTISITVNK
jgi:hypothetical protein